ncbi:hypothetical protein [Halarcobacter sp.]|uniref:hypothetical protein n=1 Tax=Halarcobacter sp. TaxID=2321133 RepID=UPI003A8FA134
MPLLDDFKSDFEVFYDNEEFGVKAIYKGLEVSLLKQEDYDFETFTGEIYSVLVSDMPNPQEEDEITIDSEVFYIQNFEYKDELKLEWTIGLVQND